MLEDRYDWKPNRKIKYGALRYNKENAVMTGNQIATLNKVRCVTIRGGPK